MNCTDEIIVKTIGKVSLLFPEIDQLKLRDILEVVLNEYEVTSKETALVASDIPQKVFMYCKMRELDGISPNTLKNYYDHLMRFSQHVIKPVTTINKHDIKRYLIEIQGNKKKSTMANEIWILKGFFQWLVDEEILQKNPAKQIKVPKVPKRLRNPLNEEELEILRQACEGKRERALVEFLFSSGARVSEVVSIKIKDLSWSDKSIRVIGKGDKERKILFSVKAKIYLQQYLDSRKDNCPFLFATEKRPIHGLSVRAVQRSLANIGKRAGLDKSVHPHKLRHTFASTAVNNGVAITAVQKLMGHESLDTTMVYTQVNEDTIKNEYKKLS